MPKPLWTYNIARKIPAINLTANASLLKDSIPIKWKRENNIAEKKIAYNCEEKFPIETKI